MCWWKIAGASLLLAGAAVPQDLAPDVLLLSRIKRHLREELAHVPNYTCLETISRFHNNPGQNPQSSQLKPLDTVRLEIVYTDHREWYGSPGARDLTVDNPVAFIGTGMIGNGAFAMTLNKPFRQWQSGADPGRSQNDNDCRCRFLHSELTDPQGPLLTSVSFHIA